MRRRAIASSLLLAAAAIAAASPCGAQVESHLDAAYAYVTYDGYLGSSAFALTPSLTWRSTHAAVAARGTYLLFESGNRSVQGDVSASAFSPSSRPGRVELAAEAGASDYANAAEFAHALTYVRLHWMESRWGIWAGALGGVAASMGAASGATGVSAGAWARTSTAAVEATWQQVSVSGVAFDDLRARARWRSGAFDLEAVAGARWLGGGPSTTYGNVSAAARVTPWMDLVLAGGNYPSDPVRGTIPGRFVSAGARLALATAPPLAAARRMPVPWPGAGEAGTLSEGRVAVEREGGQPALLVYVTGAQRVEVIGDFTDWKPVALVAAGEGRFRYEGSLPSGVLRFNVGLDGGPWGVPEGAALSADEFGGSVGVLVVP